MAGAATYRRFIEGTVVEAGSPTAARLVVLPRASR
jgi:hypothetical protein